VPEARLGTPEDEIVFAVSHDLRGPLLNFQGFLRRLASSCETLEDHAQSWELPATQRQLCRELVQQKIRPSVEVLEHNARRMDSLLNALLELSRAGREPSQLQRVAATEIALAVTEELRADAAQKAAAWRVELRVDPLPELWADPDRLTIIYRQLLSNALKFLCPERPGQITLGGRPVPVRRFAGSGTMGSASSPSTRAGSSPHSASCGKSWPRGKAGVSPSAAS
jgi:signal transduction histidine kinase